MHRLHLKVDFHPIKSDSQFKARAACYPDPCREFYRSSSNDCVSSFDRNFYPRVRFFRENGLAEAFRNNASNIDDENVSLLFSLTKQLPSACKINDC